MQFHGCFVAKKAAELIYHFLKTGKKKAWKRAPHMELFYPSLSTSVCIYMFPSPQPFLKGKIKRFEALVEQ